MGYLRDDLHLKSETNLNFNLNTKRKMQSAICFFNNARKPNENNVTKRKENLLLMRIIIEISNNRKKKASGIVLVSFSTSTIKVQNHNIIIHY